MKKNGKRPRVRTNGDHRKPPAKTAMKTAMPSLVHQPNGRGALLSGGVPGNSGGQLGRSGRKPDALREQLEGIWDSGGADVVQQILAGEITYKLNGICEHCGEASTGPETLGEVLKMATSPDTRLRAAEIPLRYTVGRERVIRLEGIPGTQRAFDVIRSTIRRKLGSGLAEELLTDIQFALKEST